MYQEQEESHDIMIRFASDWQKRTSSHLLVGTLSFAVAICFIKNLFLLICYQELMYIWNGFKVLNCRPDLVETLITLVEDSLHKLKQTKGKSPLVGSVQSSATA